MNEALRAYFPVADMIAATFGPCCEAAIHDFSQPETSVVHVAGQVTGRKVGQSFDHLIKNVLLSKDFQNDQSNNYVFQMPDREDDQIVLGAAPRRRACDRDAVYQL